MIKRASKDVTDEEIIDACERFNFMTDAAAHLGLHRNTFRSRATKLGVYKPAHKSDVSLRRGEAAKRKLGFSLDDILNGKHPQYPTFLLSKRLVKEGLIEYKCQICGINEWNGQQITLELDHENGIRTDHSLSNLRLLCPNCHSQTHTFKSKNKNKTNNSEG
jgi:5-methylcytosine-specific restriction endonuclease McrA